jgi:hypothetical protein
MRLAPPRVPFVAAILITAVSAASAQSVPSILRRGTPQRTAEQAPPVPTVLRPAAGEVVIGDLVVAVQVPPNVPAREYTLEAAHWDPGRNDWVYPGTIGDNFAGGTTATTRVAAEVRTRLNQKATRWKIHARVTQPPGSWGDWREFTWQSAPAVDRTAPAATAKPEPTPVTTPTNTANPATSEAGKPGVMVPGTTTPPPSQPATGTPPTAPNPGPPDTRAAPPTPPSTNVPAVQQPPATTVPAVQQPPALPQVPRRLPSIPNLPMRIPRSLPQARSSSTGVQASDTRAPQSPAAREGRLLSMTRLAVWDGKPMPALHQRVYVPGPVEVDWAKKSLQWWFRGLTTAPAAAVGKWRWEISRAPFGEFAAWKPAPGLGYAGKADGVQFSINLNLLAPRPPGWPPVLEDGLKPDPVIAQPGGTPPPTFSQHIDLPPDLLGGAPGSGPQRADSRPVLQKVPISLSLYVRVVPLDAAGNDADLPSNTVELRFGPVEKTPPFNPNPKHWPVVSFVSYRPVQAYAVDWQCWVEASKDIYAPDFLSVGVNPGTSNSKTVLYAKGTTRNTCAGDDSNVVDDFVDAVGGFIEMMGDFVDWVSKTYASLKSAVASKLVSMIPGCSSDPACAGAIQMGLNAGLAALGMPPDLPDFDQLQAMGEGYLVEAIAQQVAAQTNLPFADEAAKAALKEFIAQGKEAMQGGSGGSSPWIPDDSKQYKPLLLTLAVSNPSTTGATPAMYMDVSEPAGSRYKPRTVTVPSLAPGQSLKVAVSLEPVNDPKAWMELLPTEDDLQQAMTKMKLIDTKTKQAKADLQAWRTKYLTGGVNLQAALKLPPFVHKVAYKTQCFANKAACVVQ